MIIDTESKRELRKIELHEQEKKEKNDREKQKRNSNFVMVYRKHMQEIRWLTGKSGIGANIFNFILENMDYQNALICSFKIFQEVFDISESTAKRAIKLLYDNGFIDILKSGTSNVYIVNQQIAWSSWDNQKKYCKFNGNVLVSETDNKCYDSNLQAQKFKALRERENIK